MSKEKNIEQVEKFIRSGKLDKAIKELEKIADENKQDMRIRLKIADLQVKQKEVDQAVKNYIDVAESYTKEKFHLKAIAVYKTVLKLNPGLTQINEKLGDLYREVGLHDDAINQYYIVASFYDNQGKTNEAMAIRKKIVDIDPSNTTGRLRLAELMQATGKTEDSLQEYEKAAELMKKKKDRDGLPDVYEKILHHRPDNVSMLLELCRIYFEKREFKKLLRRIEASPPPLKETLDVVEVWAEALLEDHQGETARKKFQELYRLILESGDAERIAKTYSRILQEFSDDQDYLNELTEMQKEAGVSVTNVKPKHRQDFEKTEMVDLSKLDEYKKK